MKELRLIELFAGYGSQLMALKRLGTVKRSYRISEWEVNAVRSYNAVHCMDREDHSKGMTYDDVVTALDGLGISNDGKTPMSIEKIRKKGEEWCRRTYSDFIATHNVGSITNIHASDLDIVDTNKYDYLLTYSFPCQDLSLAGKQKGMKKGTRSGLLWEVERLLDECEELPKYLLMENVPQVHSKRNIDDFKRWCAKLQSLGYTSYWEDLCAKDYGIPQNRTRCFMVSILGNRNYHFPKPFRLERTLKDFLEDDAEPETSEFLYRMSTWRAFHNPLEEVCGMSGIVPTLTTRTENSSSSVMVAPCERKTINAREEIRKNNGECSLEIRRLTPRECGRLMGVSDEDIDAMEKVSTKSQLYKQFGNSIVVDVLYYIFKELLAAEKDLFDELVGW